MKRWRILAPLGLTVALATSCTSLDRPATVEGPGADAASEQAVARVKRMTEFLASREAVRFEADIQYDAVQPSGQKIEFGSHRKIAVRRPDRARVEVYHWDGERELVSFDGERLSAALPARRVYASIEFTGSVADAFDHLVEEFGVASPLADLLRKDLPAEIESRMSSGRRLGSVTIGGTRCEHLAFRSERVDFQLFIREGDEPVPVRFLIDYHAEPGGPQFRALLHDWEWGTALPDSLFRFVPQAGAQRVPFPELLDLLLGRLSSEADGV